MQENVLFMEDKRVTVGGRERKGKQSKMFFSKAPCISGDDTYK